jgi:hypothetical protein
MTESNSVVVVPSIQISVEVENIEESFVMTESNSVIVPSIQISVEVENIEESFASVNSVSEELETELSEHLVSALSNELDEVLTLGGGGGGAVVDAVVDAEVEVEVEVDVEVVKSTTKSKQLSGTSKLSSYVVETFASKLRDLSVNVEESVVLFCDLPSYEFYVGCLIWKGFKPDVSLKNPEVLHSMHKQITRRNQELNITHTFSFSITNKKVELKIRPKTSKPLTEKEDGEEVSLPVETLGKVNIRRENSIPNELRVRYPFPTRETVYNDLNNAVPKKEGQVQSVMYRVAANNLEIESFCRSIGKKFMYPPIQPLQEGLMSFVIFKEDKKIEVVGGGGGGGVVKDKKGGKGGKGRDNRH